ncbi:hypothetical protein CYMTET_25322 [Cymbomonas tetramitiformis]|uniref:OTU domain-containing protein n=1 Tax=Cymbomonas tetramitiformis TaxID=36881 RepID=A0AAE0KZA7_9CHLO|nr:hypothetical protein CYMTET_25322 [Cymbomonas tetramitiformis]
MVAEAQVEQEEYWNTAQISSWAETTADTLAATVPDTFDEALRFAVDNLNSAAQDVTEAWDQFSSWIAVPSFQPPNETSARQAATRAIRVSSDASEINLKPRPQDFKTEEAVQHLSSRTLQPRTITGSPAVHVGTSDLTRLQDRLESCGLLEHKMAADGNCQFRALSDQIYEVQSHHSAVRSAIVKQLKAHPERLVADGHQ